MELILINGYVRKTDADIQAELRNFSQKPNADFLTMYFQDKEGATNKAVHFEDNQGTIYQSLGGDPNDKNRSHLTNCVFFKNATCYYRTKNEGELDETTFARVHQITFVENTIKSTKSQEAGHNSDRFTAPA